MSDLSGLSNDELMSLYRQTDPSVPRGIRNNNPLNLEASVNWTGMKGSDGRFAVFDTMDQGLQAADRNLQTYATKHGLNTVAGIIGRWAPAGENNTNAYAKRVADGLGVDPNAPLDMTDPNVRGQLIQHMAQVENGRPLNTGKPMADLSQMSDAELMALYRQTAPAAKTPAPMRPVPQVKPRGSAPTQNPTIAQDALSGFVQPFVDLGHGVMSDYRRLKADAMAGPPTTLQDAGRRMVDNLTSGPRMVGDLLGLTAAPVQAVVRPVARGINRLPITPYKQDTPFSAPRPVQGQEAQNLVEGAINTALAGAQPARPRVVSAPAPKPMTLDELHAAKTEAYNAADAAGVQYKPQAFDRFVNDLQTKLTAARINPKRHPAAASMLEDIQAMKGQAPSLTELDQLRQVIASDVAAKPDAAEARLGVIMRDTLDKFMDSAVPADVLAGDAQQGATLINQARDLNKRYRKVSDVTDALDSAGLRTGATGSGGNIDNASRNKLIKFVDPTSRQRIRNLTPAEEAAMRDVIKGGKGQNLLRNVGKLSPQGNGLMAALNLGSAAMGGIPGAIPGVIGMASKAAADGMTARKIDDLIKLMSVGGKATKAATVTVGAIPQISLLSPTGLLGAGEVAAPLARMKVSEKPKASARKGR